jgi:hypothetical protein
LLVTLLIAACGQKVDENKIVKTNTAQDSVEAAYLVLDLMELKAEPDLPQLVEINVDDPVYGKAMRYAGYNFGKASWYRKSQNFFGGSYFQQR